MSSITVKQAIFKTFPSFNGIKVETSNDLNYLKVEKRTGHWIASQLRASKQKSIIIVSTKKPGKIISAKITCVIKSKKSKRVEIFFKQAKIENLKIKNFKLVFSRNPVGYL